MSNSDSEDVRVGNSTSTTLEFSPPKYQATIPEAARRILNVDNLEYEKGDRVEKVVCSAEITVERVYTKELE
jgi:hypothetical protein